MKINLWATIRILLFILITVCVVMFFTGCLKDPVSRESTNNSEINVQLLFEKDGCKVYRFLDGGHPVYYTDCRGKLSYESGGKTNYKVQNETIE